MLTLLCLHSDAPAYSESTQAEAGVVDGWRRHPVLYFRKVYVQGKMTLCDYVFSIGRLYPEYFCFAKTNLAEIVGV